MPPCPQASAPEYLSHLPLPRAFPLPEFPPHPSYLLPSAQWGARWGGAGSVTAPRWEGEASVCTRAGALQGAGRVGQVGRGPGPWSSTVVVSSLSGFNAGLGASVKAGMGSC